MQTNRPSGSKAGLAAGFALLALGVLIAVSTAGMDIAPSYARVSPRVFPYGASILLALTGGFFIWQALTGHADRLVADSGDVDWKAVGLISLGFIFEILTLETLGFVLSSAVLFLAVAFAFGSRRFLRDGIAAITLSVSAYLVFTKLLNLQLPAGLHAGIF